MKEEKQRKQLMWIHKALIIAAADVVIILLSYLTALLMRFDFVFMSIPEEYIRGYLWSMPFWVIATLVVFYGCRLYHSIWSLASVAEFRRILAAYVVLLIVYVAGMIFMGLRMPRSYYFMGYIISFCLTTGVRFSYRILRMYAVSAENAAAADKIRDRVMIIGAGSAGQVLIKELLNSEKTHVQVCCVIDDNPNKLGRRLEGIPLWETGTILWRW